MAYAQGDAATVRAEAARALDILDARIAANLPAWYRRGINASSFLLLPLQINDKPFGLIYADKGQQGHLRLDEDALSLLRTLRNQAVMAFKRSA